MDQRDTGKEDGLGHHGDRKMGHRDTVEGRSFHEKQGLTNLQVEIDFGQLTKCGVPTLQEATGSNLEFVHQAYSRKDVCEEDGRVLGP